MRQVLFELPVLHVPVFGYGAMLFLAFVASMSLAAWRARRSGLDPELIYDFALWVFVGGLVGARTFYVVQYWGTRVHGLLDVFKIWEGGIVFYGSIIGGTITFFLYWWYRRFPVRPVLDAVAPALALGIAIGRFGCFLNGCCYGDRCELPWAVSFPGPRVGALGNAERPLPGSPPWVDQERRGVIAPNAPRSLPVHPSQIYASIDGMVLTLLLLAYYPLRRRDGEVMALLMLTYPITRFLIEHLRNDESAQLGGMTISQLISVGLFASGLVYAYWLSRQPLGRSEDGLVGAEERVRALERDRVPSG